MRRLLFICWDGPQVNYLEGLFLPIFAGLRERYQIYILQFSWADSEKITHLERACAAMGVPYAHFPVQRRPHPLVGTITTLYKGSNFIQKFVKQHCIDILMPRSTFPAAMVLKAIPKLQHVQVIFDADGLPLEERVDFSGLNSKGLQYKLLKSFETKAIEQADIVITRTHAAIEYLTKEDPALRNKFFTVSNGRDITIFSDKGQREVVRRALGIPEDALLLVYAGSLGPQYCVAEMLQVYYQVAKLKHSVYFLILTGSQEYLARPEFAEFLNKNVIIKNASFQEVPGYLSSADVGLAIRQPSFSMKGVAPIKIGEYLLTGLPVIASVGIGDTEAVLKNEACCFVLNDHEHESLKNAAAWAVEIFAKTAVKEEARALGIREFSLKRSIKSYRAALNQLN